MAAYKAGVKTVIIPKENEADLDEIDETVRDNVRFIPAEQIQTVLDNALVFPSKKTAVKKSPSRRGRPPRSTTSGKNGRVSPSATTNAR